MRSNPATYFLLTIDADKLVVRYDGTTRPVASVDNLLAFLRSKAHEAGVPVDDLIVMTSSTLDFPEKYTRDDVVIEMARQIRSGGIRE